MTADYIIITIVLTVGAVLSIPTKKLTIAAGVSGWIIGVLVFAATGYEGVIMLAAFFIMGTMATSAGLKAKEKPGIAEKRKGQRTAFQVFANAGVAAIAGLFLIFIPKYSLLFHLCVAGSLAAATADTLSSELGNIYGSRYYNILTFKKDERGLDGVISLEGTFAGIVGSCIIALVYCLFASSFIHFISIVIAGTAGNIADSILGATLERESRIGNNAVNFLNTLVGAATIAIFYLLLK